MNWFKNYDLILASGSPRRKTLMEEAGFNFTVRVTDVDESIPEGLSVQKVASYLAEQKSLVFTGEMIPENRIIITADSVVIIDGRILGKPVSREDARQMLQTISGKMHLVITGVCLRTQKELRVFSNKTRVHVSPMTLDEIDFYVDHYQPFDKAGSYGIQEWLGICKISRIEGSYTNVMGLPMEQLYHELLKMI